MNIFEEQDRLKILEELAISNSDPEKKLTYSKELIQTAQILDSIDYLYVGYLQKGNAHKSKGDYIKALDCYIKASKFAIEEESNQKQGSVNITIADVYSELGNHKNAIDYYQRAIDILRKENESLLVATALYNAGDEYFNIKKYDSAKLYFDESYLIFKNLNETMYMSYYLGSIGMIFAEQGNYLLAKEKINQAIAILEELEQYAPISEFLISMSDIYANQNDLITALSYAQRSLEIAKRYGLKKQISETSLKLSELYEQAGNSSESFKYFKSHIVYKDSVNNIKSVQQMADLRTDFEIQKKQDEIIFLEKENEISQLQGKRQKTINYISIGAFILVLFLAVSSYRRYNYEKRTNLIIQKETDKSEELLLNILPKETALELKKKGKVQAKKFNSVSVMFVDFKNFTRHSYNLSPEMLVKSVDYYFSKFDKIIKNYGLEKIKTIGDAYMCAGGLPFPTEDHPFKMIKAAFEISEFIAISKNKNSKDFAHFDARIGINTGPVVAGVVGTTKFAYDIWGDTVNVASRMESLSKPGKINISENTYKLIKDKCECEYRGEFQVKNKGMMKMYFVNEIKCKESFNATKGKNVEV
ncbi:MAG: adenylate/guanylate cyclase domain-containing protein [Bacteroidota bacterium]